MRPHLIYILVLFLRFFVGCRIFWVFRFFLNSAEGKETLKIQNVVKYVKDFLTYLFNSSKSFRFLIIRSKGCLYGLHILLQY